MIPNRQPSGGTDGDKDSPVSSPNNSKGMLVASGSRSGRSGSRTNPFEVEPEQLTQTLSSPSIFQSRSLATPDGNPLCSSNSDQVATLWPADTYESQHLPATEDKALREESYQKAIDTFFSSNTIVPSPVSDANPPRMPGRDTTGTKTTVSVSPDEDLSARLDRYCRVDKPQDTQTTEDAANNSDVFSFRPELFRNVTETRGQTSENREFSCSLGIPVEGQKPCRGALRTSHSGLICYSQGSNLESLQQSPACGESPREEEFGRPLQEGTSPLGSPSSPGDHTDEQTTTTLGKSEASVQPVPDPSETTLKPPCSDHD